jgi:hypothetical protein
MVGAHHPSRNQRRHQMYRRSENALQLFCSQLCLGWCAQDQINHEQQSDHVRAADSYEDLVKNTSDNKECNRSCPRARGEVSTG